MRPAEYNYTQLMLDHIGGWDFVFNGGLIYPRQLEIHLPGNHKVPCNFGCSHCQGKLLEQPLDMDELNVYLLIEKLAGMIPLHIYGGAYTEPLLNERLPELLLKTKQTGSSFGIHTNGSLLLKRQGECRFLDLLCEIATGTDDYISISIDAGFPESHKATKNLKRLWFDDIIKGTNLLCQIKGSKEYPKIRFSYLLNQRNSSTAELSNIVDIACGIGADSVRFSVPYDLYGKDFKIVRHYKNVIEIPMDKLSRRRLNSLISKDGAKPHVFYIPAGCQDVDKMNFKQCVYSYYQITLASDGYVYNCSSTASPTFPFSRLGKLTGNLNDFNAMVLKSHNPAFNPEICFKNGARCNRMGLEINLAWEKQQCGKSP